jgi:CHASE2 domain-containing sensor protein
MAVGALLGAALYRVVRPQRVWRLAAIGLAAACVGLAAAWILETAWWMPVAIPLLAFGVPGAGWQLVHRRPREAARVFGAWVLATLPTLALTQPLG